jgi:photosystem II CP43 chlorophyll apoprotein
MASVDNLEDVIGGHIWIGLILIAGGIWHILVEPFGWARRILPMNDGEYILAYSLLGLALIAFISAAFVGCNTTVFPPEFYGLERQGLANIQFFLGVLAFLGYVWHTWRTSSLQQANS